MKYEYNLGKVLLTPRGDYNNSASYEPLDFVLYNNSSYVAKNNVNGHLPTDTAFWQVLASGPDTSDFVPSTRTINNKPLSSDIVLTAEDVGSITKAVDDLINYYTKSETYTKTEVSNLIETKQDKIDATNKLDYSLIANTPTIPVISNNIVADSVSTDKTTSPKAVKDYVDDVTEELSTSISVIEEKIPSGASSSNQLADKQYVNSQISTNTSTFKGTYNSVAELEAVSATNNDYAFVIETDPIGNEYYDRYKYVAGTGWAFEYKVESTPFTSEQWAAIQSGITSGLVTKLGALPTNAELNTALGLKADKSEMSVVPGTGSNSDKTTIQLKQGTTAVVLTQHQYVPVQDVTVGGSSVLSNGVAVIPAIPDVSGKADKTLVASSMPSGGFLPNVVYNLGTLSGDTTFLMAAATDNTIANIWCWTFTTPSTAPTITWPAAITGWSGGSTPTINASKSYEITVMNGLATIIES